MRDARIEEMLHGDLEPQQGDVPLIVRVLEREASNYSETELETLERYRSSFEEPAGGKEIAESLGADRVIPVPKTGGGPLGWVHLGELVRSRLVSSGGRPSNPEWGVKRLVPFSEKTWELISQKAREMSVSPGQLVGILVEMSLQGQDSPAKESPTAGPRAHACLRCEHLVSHEDGVEFPVTEGHPHLSAECSKCPYEDAYGYPPGEGSNSGSQPIWVNLETMVAWVDGSSSIPHGGCENFEISSLIRRSSGDVDEIAWMDLGSDDCSARWRGLILHTECMDSVNRFWWWSVSEADGDEIDSSNNHPEAVRSGAQARRRAEAVARRVRKESSDG